MFKRIITSIIGFPIMAYMVIKGGALLKLMLIALSVTGMYEFYRALGKEKSPVNYISYIFIIIYYIFLDNAYLNLEIMAVMPVYIASCLICLTVFYGKLAPYDIALSILGFFYAGFLMSFLYITRMHDYGGYFIWLIFISAWGCDTFAYFTGRLLGRHKLAPVLSPKKTVEGAIGGVLGSIFLSVIFAHVVSGLTNVNDEISMVFICAVLGGFGAVFAQFGDLTASAVKRFTGIKDYGKIIPGHGGVLDRFDSVLFTAPIVYAVIRLLLTEGILG